jgi:HlyD family secretion protein
VKKLALLLLLAGVAAAILWGVLRKGDPPRVAFTRVKRQTLISTLPTNGKVEPVDWQAVRAETSGILTQVFVQDGQVVAAGAPMAAISDPTLAAEIATAEARLAEANANLAALEAGGRPAEFTAIENDLARAHFDLEQARKTAASLDRLQQKQAATQQELDQAREKVQQTQLEIAGLEKRRTTLVAPPDVTAAKARAADAANALKVARSRGALSTVRAPIAGTVYGREARTGGYIETGGLIANIGRMERVRVNVYVDEPELGRVEPGQPVTITWDALPGRQWNGSVEKKPAAIQTLGSRQVGEVVCSIDNTGRLLIPGTNVNAEIRTAVAEGALVIPKETLRHDAQGDFVYTVKDGVLERRAVKKGVAGVTLVQIAQGLSEGEPVALPGDVAVKAGDRVSAAM